MTDNETRASIAIAYAEATVEQNRLKRERSNTFRKCVHLKVAPHENCSRRRNENDICEHCDAAYSMFDQIAKQGNLRQRLLHRFIARTAKESSNVV